MKKCTLCPRNCAVSRADGETGICGQTKELKVARAALHYWEEPCISGKRGSGAVFFSGCALHCVFCQNHNIANGTAGKVISPERLCEIFLELQEKGANNINLVTPGHFVPQIIPALKRAKRQGLILPVVYNTSSYESVDTIRRLDGLVDVYLPDFKYMSPELSAKYSHAADYSEAAKAAIAEMVRQTGEPQFAPEKEAEIQSGRRQPEDGEPEFAPEKEAEIESGRRQPEGGEPGSGGESRQKEQEAASPAGKAGADCDVDDPIEAGWLMKRGVIVRHLLLPGCVTDSKAVIKYLYETYGDTIYISIMNQFTPLAGLERYPELNRRVTDEEYEEVVDYAIGLGVERGFIQEGDTAEESFIPEFDCEGV